MEKQRLIEYLEIIAKYAMKTGQKNMDPELVGISGVLYSALSALEKGRFETYLVMFKGFLQAYREKI